MEKPKLIYFLFLFLSISVLALFWMDNTPFRMAYFVLILMTGFLFAFIRNAIGFVILISEIIGLGFYLTYVAYEDNLAALQQIPVVTYHVLFVFCITLLWIIFYILKKDRKNFEKMRDELKLLQRYDPQTKILTRNEFMEKAKVVWTGMKRRNEQGILLFVSLTDGANHTEKALNRTIANHLWKTVRGNYDLVGSYSSDTYIVLLQNTDEFGKSIVIERFEGDLSEEINLSDKPYTIFEHKLSDEFFELELEENRGEAL
ncbi:GGDEF domain-containing protein [Halobacillus litoralis]|uniref:GGDEF domain-containing protein n=1 Tax=Halobacillus litoralis TaxID=45668 RepID=UPI001CD7FE01|nr:GGDEF domain-containing protein [Halobacillus litoralis]MCA0970472.1 GGDEF domain-containing protein [Halobacillus litoralis]